jgi:YfiR/HmsC-like
MALLSMWTNFVAKGRAGIWLIASVLLISAGPEASAQTAITREYEIKAVFLFNFAQFVDWPPEASASPQAPLIIGVLGDDPFDGYLDDTVRGEKLNNRPFVVQRYHRVEDIDGCHVLFISRTNPGEFGHIMAALKGRSILTVGDTEGFCHGGGIIRFVTENNRIRFRINVEAAEAAHLVISSKLLRLAEVVTRGTE